MRAGVVCAGTAAEADAWHDLGIESAYFAEIDPWCRAYLRHHHPAVPLHNDFTSIKGQQYGSIDILCGGTPCQAFSVAGKRKGMDDDRGNLALGYVELAKRERPQWLVWENVPGILFNHTPTEALVPLDSSGECEAEEVSDFGCFVSALSELGYGLAWRCFDTQFMRVESYPRAIPQRRNRVFLVGYLGDWRPAAGCLFERESLSWNPEPRREKGQEVAGTLGSCTDGGGFRTTDLDGNGALIPEVAMGITASSGKRVGMPSGPEIAGQLIPEVAGTLINRMHKGVSSTIDDQLIPIAPGQITSPDNRSAPKDGDPAPTLTGDGKPPVIAFSQRDDGSDAKEDVAPTLRAMGHDKSHANGGGQLAVAYDQRGRDGGNMVEGPYETAAIRAASGGSTNSLVHQNWRVRRLTVTECERLMGLKDGQTNIPWRGKEGSPASRRYKALGNAQSRNTVRWIGQRMIMMQEVLQELGKA